MSSYYGNLLQANLPTTGSTPNSQDFLGHESKFDNSFYANASQGGLNFDGETPPTGQHPGFPRFPPYDRLEIRPIGGAKSQGSFPSTTHHGLYQTTSLPNYTFPTQNGQYNSSADDLNGCKLPQDSPLLGTTASGPVGQMPSPMVNPFNPTAGLGGMVNGMSPHSQAAQNIPIYPWMRPMNGGKTQCELSPYIGIGL